MTWDDLASKIITQMTPEERQQEARFVEYSNEGAISLVGLRKANESLERDGERIEAGEWYIW